MDSDYGIPRELSNLQKLRSLYQPEVPPCLQGTTVRVEFGDATTAADLADAHTIARSFPHTYGQPLAHFLRATAKVPDAQIITEHPPIRVGVVFCGRQSPGGHNVIWGLHNALKIHNPNNILLGFLGKQRYFYQFSSAIPLLLRNSLVVHAVDYIIVKAHLLVSKISLLLALFIKENSFVFFIFFQFILLC
uniref:Pyrophosphatefructose 6-phosphate 1-phosphotransferase subunit alpha PFP 6-phosphofructokinase pyrophosphate dependent PPi-PFK Pyrophosphate-dependent 6-phosphofructose-1-kinase n=1 Tax=Rhizophora mucronata TaxID=61149 RepID=A0A2P2MDT4_RHIMU